MLNKQYKRKRVYKDFLRSRKNITGDKKVFFFRKKKWKTFNFFEIKKLKYFRRYRFRDQAKNRIQKFSGFGNSFKKQYRNYLHARKVFQIFYGDITKKKLKESLILKNGYTSNKNYSILALFEQKLSVVLYRIKFCCSIRQAKQLIKHGHVLVNNKKVRSSNFCLKYGDTISVQKESKSRTLVRQNLLKNRFWPVPPSFIVVNYKTLTAINLFKTIRNKEIFLTFDLKLDFLKNLVKFK